MRLGGPIFAKPDSPERWTALHREVGYRAAYCPVGPDATDAEIADYRDAAAANDLVIAETGAWSNPISPNAEQRAAAIDKCIAMLALADRIGARCCVNLAGSMSTENWHGPHAENYSPAAFDRIVETVQHIIDQAQPRHASYTLEMMSWCPPDSPESYLELIHAIDRDRFAVHFDPVNLINSPRRYYAHGEVIRDVVNKLGPRIRSVHVKDVTLTPRQLVHLDECRPGTGALDYPALFAALDELDPDLPLMLEHLPDAEQYALAADHLRHVAREGGWAL
ncbi:MAG: TIM barrel protein [Planctomycetes bacterium]|jgi:sugar phosphate isomerase/epimerase|nr:TIM barrel protein [Planctomycetota bacterium]